MLHGKRVGEDEISKDELDELDRDIAQSLPASVAKHLPDHMKASQANLSRTFTSKAAVLADPATNGPASVPPLDRASLLP